MEDGDEGGERNEHRERVSVRQLLIQAYRMRTAAPSERKGRREECNRRFDADMPMSPYHSTITSRRKAFTAAVAAAAADARFIVGVSAGASSAASAAGDAVVSSLLPPLAASLTHHSSLQRQAAARQSSMRRARQASLQARESMRDEMEPPPRGPPRTDTSLSKEEESSRCNGTASDAEESVRSWSREDWRGEGWRGEDWSREGWRGEDWKGGESERSSGRRPRASAARDRKPGASTVCLEAPHKRQETSNMRQTLLQQQQQRQQPLSVEPSGYRAERLQTVPPVGSGLRCLQSAGPATYNLLSVQSLGAAQNGTGRVRRMACSGSMSEDEGRRRVSAQLPPSTLLPPEVRQERTLSGRRVRCTCEAGGRSRVLGSEFGGGCAAPCGVSQCGVVGRVKSREECERQSYSAVRKVERCAATGKCSRVAVIHHARPGAVKAPNK